MDKITVPFNKTSDKKVISQILKMQYIESLKNECIKFVGEFNAKSDAKKWVQISEEAWLYTPLKCIIYDPAKIPRGVYQQMGKRFMKKEELTKTFYLELESNPFYNKSERAILYIDDCKNKCFAYCVIFGEKDYFKIYDGCFYRRGGSFNNDYVRIRVDDIPQNETLLSYMLQNNFNIFEGDTTREKFFDVISTLYKCGKITVGNTIELKNEFVNELMSGSYLKKELGDSTYDFIENVMTGHETGCYKNLLEKDAIAHISDGVYELDKSIKEGMMKSLLDCDKIRNAMDSYDETRLKDPNGGHWDLWDVSSTCNSGKKADKNNPLAQVSVSIKSGWMGRNPVADVRPNGIVGIDFGTKSTVVTYRDGRAKVRPLRIGKGNYANTIRKEDYENPTVIEFKDIVSFLEAYHEKEGRPNTLWEEITVSHTAAEQMKAPTSQELISSFFSDIKQWTSDPDRQVRIRDQKSFEKVLGQYGSLKEDTEFDPLEIYAYYLGLFINNMRQGIYLRYRLSYPAKAEIELREKIRKSFERGLKKSLPEAVLYDADCMSKFKVELGMSEPAAYAISALKGYGFGNIEDGDKIVYGIFDFGGGTTDFDFGVWETEIESRSYDYRITHFGENGDPYLGGENLIELMAFEVFKYNKDTLLKDHIVFSKPHNCELFIGSEMLISDSREAIVNLKKLAETLRGFWHGDSEAIKNLAGGNLSIQLWPR